MLEIKLDGEYAILRQKANPNFYLSNIAKLALYVYNNLDAIQKNFNMKWFMTGTDGYSVDNVCKVDAHPCGTCACFAGYGPMAGIGWELPHDLQEYSGWFSYLSRNFTGSDESVFESLFSEYFPDSAPQAVLRAQRFLMGDLVPNPGRDVMSDEDLFTFEQNRKLDEIRKFDLVMDMIRLRDEIDVDFLTQVAEGHFTLC